MNRIATIVACVASVGALGVTGAAAKPGNGHGNGGNGNGPDAHSLVSKQCTREQHRLGTKAFKEKYGKHAMKACKRQNLPEVKADIRNASQECRAEQADPAFGDTHGGATFDAFYGTNHNDRNAFGKCVSGKVRAAQANDGSGALSA